MLKHGMSDGGRDLVRAFVGFAGARAVVATTLIAVGALFEGVGLVLLVPLLGVLLEPHSRTGSAGMLSDVLVWLLDGYGPSGRIMILLALFALLIIARGFVLTARDSLLAHLQHGFAESIRLRLIQRIAAAPWQAVSKLKHARVVHVMSLDMQQIGVAAHFVLQCAVAMVMLGVSFGLGILLAPVPAAIAMSLLLLGALASRPYLRRARALGDACAEANILVTDGAIRLLDGLKLATAQNLQPQFVQEYEAASTAAVRHRVDFIRLQTAVRNLSTSLAALVGALTVVIGITLLHLPAAILIALVLLLSRMSTPALLIQQGAQQIAQSLPSFRAVQALEAALPCAAASEQRVGAPELPTSEPRCSIALKEVSFLHETAAAEEPAGLRHLSVTVPAGTFVGITGPSGSGKTTFIDLVAGILTPQTGTIMINGAVLTEAQMRHHREHVAYVSHDPVLFGDSIRRNLLLGAPLASEEAMWHAIELVGADDLVRRLGRGLDSALGERGVLISAGERQRLALARALLRRALLIILDEATSSIDAAGERAIFQALRRLTPRPTILMVSHRAESLLLCDRILSFSAGRLVGDATMPRPSDALAENMPHPIDDQTWEVTHGVWNVE